MRSVETTRTDGTPRFTPNVAPASHMAILDRGHWPDGVYAAPAHTGLRFDLKKHADLGVKTVREHVGTESDQWYCWADDLGLLVWQDGPAAASDYRLSSRQLSIGTCPPSTRSSWPLT
jgi:hypothetical protein